IGGAGLAVTAERRALPVVALLPDVPFAGRVEAVQLVGAQRDRRVEVELQRITRLLEYMLGHDPDGVAAPREQCMEAGVGLLPLEMHRMRVGRRDALDIEPEQRAPAHAGILDLRHDGVDDIVGRERDAVAPVDVRLQLHRHLGEIAVVDRLLGGERVLPWPVEAPFGVDVPEGIERELVQARVLRSEEHTSELQSRENLVCRLLLEKKKMRRTTARKYWTRCRS